MPDVNRKFFTFKYRLHWLRMPERIEFKLAVLVYRCLHGLAPSYFADSFLHVADVESRRRLRSASTDELIIPSMRLSTIGDRAFHVAAARTWNSLPLHVTSAPSLPILKHQLKTALFTRSYPDCVARVLTSAPSSMSRVAIFLILYGVLAVTIDFMPP